MFFYKRYRHISTPTVIMLAKQNKLENKESIYLIAEYIWIDGNGELRSKARTLNIIGYDNVP